MSSYLVEPHAPDLALRHSPPESAVGDVGELYSGLSRRLEQIVRRDVRAPEAVIEDACQFAWSRLLHRRHDVRRETVLAWLVKVAIHEAFKLIRRDDRELSLDATLDGHAERLLASPAPGPDEIVEQREQLATISSLPDRQQRILWLRALGLSYEEMALFTGCTPRTIERQLQRARARIRFGEATAE
jgi:RNA polymerase sigma factor (sigma-70 family)